MKESLSLIEAGFESSSGLTEEFKKFFNVFKREFTIELKAVAATDIKFNRGHFSISGFFTFKEQPYYFSLPDVRGMDYGLRNNPDSCMNQLLYRTVKDYNDYVGGQNEYVKIKFGMFSDMFWYFGF
jgi:hypothetical protein